MLFDIRFSNQETTKATGTWHTSVGTGRQKNIIKLPNRKAKIIATVKPPLESIANVLIASAGLPPESVMHASKTIYRKTIGRL